MDGRARRVLLLGREEGIDWRVREMNNREWLYSLDPKELSAWFEAPRYEMEPADGKSECSNDVFPAENAVRADDMRSNDAKEAFEYSYDEIKGSDGEIWAVIRTAEPVGTTGFCQDSLKDGENSLKNVKISLSDTPKSTETTPKTPGSSGKSLEEACDSREKIKAEVADYFKYDFGEEEEVSKVLGWLDRQAVLTAREFSDDFARIYAGDGQSYNEVTVFGMPLEDVMGLRKENVALLSAHADDLERIEALENEVKRLDEALGSYCSVCEVERVALAEGRADLYERVIEKLVE